MKQVIFFALAIFFAGSLQAQRPATTAETAEDARVLNILSQSMPHEIDGWLDEGERSFGISSLTGITGFYNNMNFATRDIFDHQYTITYRLVNASDALKQKAANAKTENDFAELESASRCEINILVNAAENQVNTAAPFTKLNLPFCSQAYRDAAKKECTVLYFGNNWTLNPSAETVEDGRGRIYKNYFISTKLKNTIGTVIQSIQVIIKCNSEVADLMMSKINWNKINSLLGTGAFSDNTGETDLKKYFTEKPVANIPGKNTLSFTMIGEDGVAKEFAVSSSKIEFANSAILRNHNENPKVLQEAHIDFHIEDDKNPGMSFMMSLPIIRTTGKVTATFQSDYDYQVMWRGNTDANHSFSPGEIEIHLTKWAPVGDFLEGTFSGTATLKDHNNFSTQQPAFTIRNGKFRIRRIADQIK
ncbi:MAG: hypothetical protein U0V75_13990 [Ferruginibacter sp.]